MMLQQRAAKNGKALQNNRKT